MPGVKTASSSNRVMVAIGKLPGVDVKGSDIDLTKGMLSVRHDTMKIALKNIEYAISDVGFDANEITADPAAKAKLPVKER